MVSGGGSSSSRDKTSQHPRIRSLGIGQLHSLTCANVNPRSCPTHPTTTAIMATPAPAGGVSGTNISKRRKFVADGVFYAELNEFFQRELAEEGYSGVEVRVTPTVTDIIIRATHTQEVLGEQGRRIRELTSLITHRFRFPPDSVSLYAAKVQSRGLSAVAQCESLRYKLLNGLAVRRACYGVLR